MTSEEYVNVLNALRDTGIDIGDLFCAAVDEATANALKKLEDKKQREESKFGTVEYTRRLLRHYRLLKDAHADAVYNLVTLPEQEGEHEREIEDLMRNTISKYDVRIESVEKCAARTHLYMKDIDGALAGYQRYCLTSGNKAQQRRWRVIEAKYLSENPKTTQQIANDEYVDTRTVQRDLEMALEEMTIRIFGLDGFINSV